MFTKLKVGETPYCQSGFGHQTTEHLLQSSPNRLALENSTLEKVNLAAVRQTPKYSWRPPGRLQSVFGGRYRDSRVFLAAAMLTLESFWGRVVLACYTGTQAVSLMISLAEHHL
ncbi:hypothetical protein PoB_006650500 [Plakobranchus ocellatus]|uniref:Uncharacterized protein n=1 Tax=Plakobranchus ocellatus TaxID=259542 RepID=A0AAV4D7B3_9GAST|nr:hypothetical protein PoB_006650500 [Plakobranchus ocellatus]